MTLSFLHYLKLCLREVKARFLVTQSIPWLLEVTIWVDGHHFALNLLQLHRVVFPLQSSKTKSSAFRWHVVIEVHQHQAERGEVMPVHENEKCHVSRDGGVLYAPMYAKLQGSSWDSQVLPVLNIGSFLCFGSYFMSSVNLRKLYCFSLLFSFLGTRKVACVPSMRDARHELHHANVWDQTPICVILDLPCSTFVDVCMCVCVCVMNND